MDKNTKLELSMDDMLGGMKAFGKNCIPEGDEVLVAGAGYLVASAIGGGVAAAGGAGLAATVGVGVAAGVAGVGVTMLALGVVKTYQERQVAKDLRKAAQREMAEDTKARLAALAEKAK